MLNSLQKLIAILKIKMKIKDSYSHQISQALAYLNDSNRRWKLQYLIILLIRLVANRFEFNNHTKNQTLYKADFSFKLQTRYLSKKTSNLVVAYICLITYLRTVNLKHFTGTVETCIVHIIQSSISFILYLFDNPSR